MSNHVRDMRAMAQRLYGCAIAAADPALAVRRHFQRHPDPDDGGRSHLVAIGKAAPAMLAEAMNHVRNPVSALAVTHRGNEATVPGAVVLTAGHPDPDEDGLEASRRIMALLASATGPHDRVYALISGGGSALVPAPRAPLTLQDKQAVTAILLASGLDISAMNLVRQQLSELKGGGLLRHAAPAAVVGLILSDVIGDDLAAVASGPTSPPLGDRQAARALLSGTGLLQDLPLPVRDLLSTPAEPDPVPQARNYLVGSNVISLRAMRDAIAPGWAGRIVSDQLVGDVADAAERIVSAARQAPPDRPTALIFGGETTVTLRGDGKGGRNQELALRVALGMRGWSGLWTFMSAGTDGRDGPTDAAGAIVDPGTLDRIAAAGLDVQSLLANNDSHACLSAANDLLVTGASGTNVADVQVMLIN
ncbi:DUF4147 domain-containing protein [Paracoccus sp. CPCC 101403]|uniref:DUF4147 domain-containing protein n=1 Tax=Paracoccus broussonetiae TaxID=3075834 RepID=A0ABU3EIB9_9RHOB|nr:DUF4147 domain-containing protein [Paracoccus sp. CPCC 101403]MDT1063994.1 DUF4147 domain-containing protein [Paracoccus sp. CPCC 101403]